MTTPTLSSALANASPLAVGEEVARSAGRDAGPPRDHGHAHGHGHDHAHAPAGGEGAAPAQGGRRRRAPAVLGFSLVRASLSVRLAIAGGLSLLVWAAVLWARLPITP